MLREKKLEAAASDVNDAVTSFYGWTNFRQWKQVKCKLLIKEHECSQSIRVLTFSTYGWQWAWIVGLTENQKVSCIPIDVKLNSKTGIFLMSFIWTLLPCGKCIFDIQGDIYRENPKNLFSGHNFWLECQMDLRPTPLSYIFNALFRATPLGHFLHMVRWPSGCVLCGRVAWICITLTAQPTQFWKFTQFWSNFE